jgi:hypothetical protein
MSQFTFPQREWAAAFDQGVAVLNPHSPYLEKSICSPAFARSSACARLADQTFSK